MSKISVTIEGSCQTNPSTQPIYISEHDLLWAMVYANKVHRDFTTASDFSKYFEMQKSRMNFIFDCSGPDLAINDCVYKLEQSYRGTIAFDIGMILASIVCKKCLNLKHLYHLKSSKYFLNSLPKPTVDFISQNISGYFVIEAKGTLRGVWYGEFDAKKQLQNAQTVNGKTPKKYSALTRCIVNSAHKHIIDCRLIDPESRNDEDLKIKNDFWDYQKEFWGLFDKEFKNEGTGVLFKYVEGDGAFLGIFNPNAEKAHEEKIIDNFILDKNNIQYSVKFFEDGTIIGLKNC